MLRREDILTESDASEEEEESKEPVNGGGAACDCENTDGEDESLPKKEQGTLKSGMLALKKLQ